MKKESSTNLQKYSGIAEQMVKMSSDCPEITKMILDIIYGDEGEGNGISTNRIGDIIGPGYTHDIEPDKAEHKPSETEKYFQRLAKRNNIDKFKKA